MAVPTSIHRRWAAKSYNASLTRARLSQSPFQRRIRLLCKMVRVGGGFIAALFAIWVLSDATGVADSATTWAIDFLGKAIKVALSFLDFLASGKALA